jgi:hypothetical protein
VAAERKWNKLSDKNAVRNTLQAVGGKWLDKFSVNNVEETNKRTKERLAKKIYPYLGAKDTNKVTAPELLMVLRRVENMIAFKRVPSQASPYDTERYWRNEWIFMEDYMSGIPPLILGSWLIDDIKAKIPKA